MQRFGILLVDWLIRLFENFYYEQTGISLFFAYVETI